MTDDAFGGALDLVSGLRRVPVWPPLATPFIKTSYGLLEALLSLTWGHGGAPPSKRRGRHVPHAVGTALTPFRGWSEATLRSRPLGRY